MIINLTQKTNQNGQLLTKYLKFLFRVKNCFDKERHLNLPTANWYVLLMT